MRNRCAVRFLTGGVLLVALASGCGGGSSPVQPEAAPVCRADLWNHVYDPARLQVRDACRTVTGDVTSELLLDPGFQDLLNQDNISKLGGNLHIEEVCQGKITRDAFDSCRGF